MPSFRSGFRPLVAELVREVRADFGCRIREPLDVKGLIHSLKIPLIGVSELAGDGRFSGVCDSGVFHAATIPLGHGNGIIYNDHASERRQRSDLSHELGHVFLEHPLSAICDGEVTDRSSEVEREADWFGFSLLIPDEAALSLARSGFSIEQAAEYMNVSMAAARFRLNASGAMKRAANERRRRRRS